MQPGHYAFLGRGLWSCVSGLGFRGRGHVAYTRYQQARRSALSWILGHKSVAAEKPIGNRAWFPDLPEATPFLQSEEHFVLDAPNAGDFSLSVMPCWRYLGTFVPTVASACPRSFGPRWSGHFRVMGSGGSQAFQSLFRLWPPSRPGNGSYRNRLPKSSCIGEKIFFFG